ncbi:TetR family transcriptional regulator [Streptomyces sp. FR-108]|uniref:TetR/AcrR family transcriptional regulator n=1 Tax=Streptomyces sp. FR-108 TaxID=3416665 RepID=UPI003CFB1454
MRPAKSSESSQSSQSGKSYERSAAKSVARSHTISVGESESAGTGAGGATVTDAAAGPGRRDAEATKAAILRAARHLLARHAHADITLKAVAERAGVSPPLIMKYFGNKETLFARVMSFEEDAAALLDAPVADLGRHMVRHVLVSQSERGADPLLRIVFAPLQGAQGDTLRANFRTQVSDRLALRLDGPDAGLRAELAVGMLLGLGVMYGIARGGDVRKAPLDAVVARYAPAVQAHLTP